MGRKANFLLKKVEKLSDPHILPKTIVLQDHIRYVQNNMGLQNKGTYNEQLFCYTEVQSAEYHYSLS